MYSNSKYSFVLFFFVCPYNNPPHLHSIMTTHTHIYFIFFMFLGGKINICLFLFLDKIETGIEDTHFQILVTISCKVTQMQSDLWQGDVIPKTEYAHQWSPNLHNEETSISASNIFDISNLELRSNKVKNVDRHEKRKEWKQRALSVCEEGTQSWTHTHTHNFVSQKHRGSLDWSSVALSSTERELWAPPQERLFWTLSDSLTKMTVLTLIPCRSFALIVDSIC